MLKGKHILLGITGGIAAYKTPFLVRELKRAGADVHVIMTESAKEFVTPTTLSTVSGHEVVVDTFPSQKGSTVDASTWHVKLGIEADAMVIAPATANTIAKIASGLADNAVTTLVLALRAPLIISPTMDVDMWNNSATQTNVAKLREMGCLILPPDEGELASGLVGVGRLPEIENIVKFVEEVLDKSRRDFKGKKILVTAGPTYEPIDPVRFIGNRSSGKMGYAIAATATMRGADVTLVSGPTQLATPRGVQRVDVETAEEMRNAVLKHAKAVHAIIMAAAVADFRPSTKATQKIKKNGSSPLTLELSPTTDILAEIGARKGKKVIVGFALETQNGEANAKEKLRKKHLDFIVLNNPTKPGAAFGGDTNIVTIMNGRGKPQKLPRMLKYDVANEILNRVAKLLR